MSRILIAWELGGNLGHVLPLLVLARALRAKGNEVLFALRDVRASAGLLQRENFRFVQAPHLAPSRIRGLAGGPASYPEILLYYGFADAPALEAQALAWRHLFALAKPDALLLDHAPTALLAARGLPFRKVLFSTGFTSPPRIAPMASIRPWQRIPMQRLQGSEQRALHTANAVLGTVGAKPLEELYELFDADEDILATLPELDHYGARPNARYWGPVADVGRSEAPAWPGGEGKKVFVYIRAASPAFKPLYAAMRNMQASVLWFAPGLTEAAASTLSSASIRITSSPLDMTKVAGSAAAAIFHGGHGTAAAMLLAGVPMFLIPENIEQLLIAQRVSAIGAGTAALPPAVRAGLAQRIAVFLADGAPHAAASRIAKRYRHIESAKQIEAMAEAILRPSGNAS